MKKDSGFGLVQSILALVIAGALGTLGWYVYSSNESNKSIRKASDNTGQANDSQNQAADKINKYYKISDLKIKIKLTNDTEDLVAKVSEDKLRAYFSLSSFVKKANDTNEALVINGVNNCERVASISVYQSSQRSELESSPIQSYRFDASGKPLDKEIVLLADGRYVHVSLSQSTCIRTDGSNLMSEETIIRQRLVNLLENNIESL